MPFKWTISHDEHLVSVTAEGVLDRANIEAYLDAVVLAGAGPYAKLVELGNAGVALSDHDMLMLGARLRAYFSTGPAGPLAFVVTQQQSGEYALRFINLASGGRPAQVFATAEAAREWLAKQKK
jgi:hypothetical protein